MKRRTSRRASNAIEFALTLPVYLFFIAGVVDYGWYFNQQMVTTMVARDAARACSLVPLGDQVEPVGEAQGQVSLEIADLQGTTDCTLTGTAPDQQVSCNVQVTFEPLLGLTPVPAAFDETVVMRMAIQPGTGP